MIGKIYSPPTIIWPKPDLNDNDSYQKFRSITSSPARWSDSGSPLQQMMPYRSRTLSRPTSPQTRNSSVSTDGWHWPAPIGRSTSSSSTLNSDGTLYRSTQIILFRGASGYTFARQ